MGPLGSMTMMSVEGGVSGILLGGPQLVSGRVTSIAIADNYRPAGATVDQKAAFLGEASGGVWRSTDFDANGNLRSAPLPTWNFVSGNIVDPTRGNAAVPRESIVGANNIGALAVDPSRPNVLYAGTGEANFGNDTGAGTGILKSTDGGNTWFVAARGTAADANAFVGHAFSKIIVDPTVTTGDGTLYAAVVPVGWNLPTAADGIYKSTNGGTTWTMVRSDWVDRLCANPLMVVTDLDYTIETTMTGNRFDLFAGIGNPRGYG